MAGDQPSRGAIGGNAGLGFCIEGQELRQCRVEGAGAQGQRPMPPTCWIVRRQVSQSLTMPDSRLPMASLVKMQVVPAAIATG